MAPDDFQQAWQAHASQTRVRIYDDLLLKELQSDLRRRQAVPFWTSCILLGTAPLMLIWYCRSTGPRLHFRWYQDPFFWIIGWMFVSSLVGLRRSLAQRSTVPASLLDCLKSSLNQVEQEIDGARNSWKWILQVTVLSCAFFFYVGGSSAHPMIAATIFIMAIDHFLIRLLGNWSWEPQRQKLLLLLQSLTDEVGTTKAVALTNTEYINKFVTLMIVSLCGVIITWTAVGDGSFGSHFEGAPRDNGPKGASLANVVSELRKQHNLVSLAAMVSVDGKVIAATADGERKNGSGVSVELTDRWHLGGVTKSINATMIARLVEKGQMQWSETVGERFADDSVHEGWKPVTLTQLLTDTAGAPANFSYLVRLKQPAPGPQCTRERRKAVLNVLAEKPTQPPGQKFLYSNVGCTIAAAMAESATGLSWEDLVQREVFDPLELTDAGFGPPQNPPHSLDQPVGHRILHGRKFSVDDKTDNTTIMGPSGRVHMTLSNLCTYLTEHLRGERGEGKLLFHRDL